MADVKIKTESTRDGFGKALLKLGEINENVVVLSADLTESVRAHWFKEKFPERFISHGVAEQDMIGAAAGFALAGKVPFACTFGAFASGRAWDQVRVSVAYMNLNVTYNPKSKEELYNLITKKKLLPKSQMGALKYGYYLYGRRGEEFNHFDPNKHIKPPKHINQNLYIFNLDPKRRINIASIINPFLFIVSRLVNNFILFPTIPKKEK